MSAILTKEEEQQIESAVKMAESKISGEIVPVILQKSHHYPSTKYKLALIASVVMFLIIIAGDRLLSGFNLYDPIYYFSLSYGAAVLGFIAPVLFPSLAVSFASEKEKSHAVMQKAETIFLESEVFNTKSRTGIMLFVSLAERRALVMADTGINEKVDQSTWDDLVGHLIDNIKRNEMVTGITDAIASASKILLDNEFTVDADDKNELPDNIITD
ncbi:MAG: hypothetical protein ABJH05_14140 [Fulvivirga sp.]